MLYFVLALCLCICLAVILAWVGHRLYGHDTYPDRIDRVSLPGGWVLCLEQHRPQQARRGVVVVCHGFAVNRFNLDLVESHSLVRYLCRQGFEVWNVELRGSGRSRHPDVTARARAQWTFDDHVRDDVPAILNHVTTAAQCDQVHWVGHSMGGLVMYGHLGRVPEEPRLASLCAIASPVFFKGQSDLGLRFILAFVRGFSLFAGRFPIDTAAKIIAPLYRFKIPFDLFTIHGTNLDPVMVRRALYSLNAPPSREIIEQFRKMFLDDDFCSRDGADDYRENLKNVRTPVCCIAGTADRLAPPEQMRSTYLALGASLKEFYLMGKETGARHDYCHGGLVLAQHAPTEVYPVIERWLDDRCAGASGRAEDDRPWREDAA